jgi:hypothetical protein
MTDRELLRANFTLRNDTKVPIKITGIVASCSCTTILPEDQSETPFTIPPGGTKPLALTTNLASRFGPQTYVITIASEAGGRALRLLQGQVDVLVDAPLSPFPSSIDAGQLEPGRQAKLRVVLGDTFDANTVGIIMLQSSDPSAVAVESAPIEEVVQKGRGYIVHGRYALSVTINPDDRSSTRREWLTIGLSDGREIKVPIAWSVAIPCEISPRELIIAGAKRGQRIERSVFVRRAANERWTPRILHVPSGVEAALDPFGADQWRLRVSLVVPDASELGDREIVLAAGQADKSISIPLDVRYDQ